MEAGTVLNGNPLGTRPLLILSVKKHQVRRLIELREVAELRLFLGPGKFLKAEEKVKWLFKRQLTILAECVASYHLL